LVVGQVPVARWGLDWHRGAAIRAERRGDLAAAAAHWTAIEQTADPLDGVDAVFIENAARFRLRRHDYIGARNLLISVAPALYDAKIFRDVGFLLAQREPTDQRLALRYWRKAAWCDPTMPDVLNAIAWSMVAADSDSTAGPPGQARELAMRAVALDNRHTPEFMATLAWAEYRCGNTSSAIGWMRRAIASNPRDRASFLADLATLEQE
jgi:tetratricopeptide (TPR) repeat protein